MSIPSLVKAHREELKLEEVQRMKKQEEKELEKEREK